MFKKSDITHQIWLQTLSLSHSGDYKKIFETFFVKNILLYNFQW